MLFKCPRAWILEVASASFCHDLQQLSQFISPLSYLSCVYWTQLKVLLGQHLRNIGLQGVSFQDSSFLGRQGYESCFSHSNIVSAPGCLLKFSFLFLNVHWLCVIWIVFQWILLPRFWLSFFSSSFYTNSARLWHRFLIFSPPQSFAIPVSRAPLHVPILFLFYCVFLGLCIVPPWFWYSVL